MLSTASSRSEATAPDERRAQPREQQPYQAPRQEARGNIAPSDTDVGAEIRQSGRPLLCNDFGSFMHSAPVAILLLV